MRDISKGMGISRQAVYRIWWKAKEKLLIAGYGQPHKFRPITTTSGRKVLTRDPHMIAETIGV